ncbi:SseB family protein [Actinomyces respiraculi]|uniref:SseB family protein n=1 Tax=Actinomyces respiraculi TaxID=2744574 RepID=UPI0018E0AC8B|nr:SseB family protein [Actinomyces respiraculi]
MSGLGAAPSAQPGDDGAQAGRGADPQVTAALAARAKMARLLAAPTPFSDDDGSADPAVIAALEATGLPRHEYLDALWAALAASRVIVPVAAHAITGGLSGPGPDATGAPGHEVHTADAAQDAATLAVDLPDGHIALPVFTSVEAMRAWRDDVRPVPVQPGRAAQVAVLETDQLWVLDPGTRDLRLPRPAIVALAGGEDWVPSWRNEPVQAEVAAQLGAIEGITGVAFAPGEGAELRVFLRLDSSGGMSAVAAALEECQMVMVNPAWGELIDTLELCPVPA